MRRIFKNVEKIPVTLKDVFITFCVIVFVALAVLYLRDISRETLKAVCFTLMLMTVVYLRKYFFPFVFASVACYLMAATQYLWDENYKYLAITSNIRFAGDIFLFIGFFHFIIRLMFKYEIIERHEIEREESKHS